MHACTSADAQSSSVLDVERTMAEWPTMDHDWPPDEPYNMYNFGLNEYFQEYQEKPPPPLLPPMQTFPPPPHAQPVAVLQVQAPPQPPGSAYTEYTPVLPRGENPRELRNKAEKQRRDKLNSSISELASMVPPVVAANKKIDKTGVLRLTAHYLRAYQYVFGDSIGRPGLEFTPGSTHLLLTLLNGFLLTTTYKGLVVVVSQNIQQYLGHAELNLLGQNIFNYIHPDDHQTMRENLMPHSSLLGPNGELLIPDDAEGKRNIAAALAHEKRRFLVRFKKHGQRSEPASYVACFVEGTLRKSDKACRVSSRRCQMVRRARARGDNPCSSGNDAVFIGLVRPAKETFMTEKRMEAYKMEYRTRHSIDGQIIECEQRISLVAGYMTHEVNGVNAMTFMHRDDVRWVIFALREMYDQRRLIGESCYRLMTKNGQFIYLKTRGVLDVDEDTRAARSFVCTNTVVGEEEGKHLIELMKKRCMMMIANQKTSRSAIEEFEEVDKNVANKDPEDEILPVPDLEKVILNLVTDLPSPQQSGDSRGNSPDRRNSLTLPLSIIPPRKEKIISAIEKYSQLANSNITDMYHNEYQRLKVEQKKGTRPTSPSLSPVHQRLSEQSHNTASLRRRLEGTIVPQTITGFEEENRDDIPLIDTRYPISSIVIPSVTTALAITLSEPADATTLMPLDQFGIVPATRKRAQPNMSTPDSKKPNNTSIQDYSMPYFETVPVPACIQELPDDVALTDSFEFEEMTEAGNTERAAAAAAAAAADAGAAANEENFPFNFEWEFQDN